MKRKFNYIIYEKFSKFNESLSNFLLRIFRYKTNQDGKKDLEYYKSEEFYKLAVLFIVLGLLPIVYGAYMFFKENNIMAGVLELLIYFVILVVISSSQISISKKRYIFVLCIYLLGLMLLFIKGPMGAGLVVIVTTFGLAAFLLNKRQNIYFIFISLLVFIGISVFFYFRLLNNLGIYQYKESWYIVAISAQLMGILFVFIINNLFSNIENQIEEIENRTKTILESEQKYRLLFELSGVLIGYYSPNGVLISYNKRAAEYMGGIPEDFSGKLVYDLFPKSYADKLLERINKALSSDTPMEYESLVPFITGEKWLFTTINRIIDSKGDAKGVQVVSVDIDDRKQVEERLIYSSIHDDFTDLYNRVYFEGEKTKIDKDRNSTYAIILIDINGLQLTNDAFGYDEGDYLILKTAKIIQSCCFNNEIVARIGGDDFGILMQAGENEAKDLIQRIMDKCYEYNKALKNSELSISLSTGYSLTSENKSVNKAQKEAVDSLQKNKMLEAKSHQSSIIATIMATMIERSQETKEHGDRIALYSKMIGEKIGLPPNSMDQLHLLSMLHDIGKIGIDDRILNKPGKLNNEEWIEMKKHAEIGYRIAMSTSELTTSAELILTHHERWDGKGYPQGLSGEDIPLLSRILAIADAYDAMTENRVYRKAMTSEEALAEIKNNLGTQFDPQLAELFIKLIQEII
ncbi:MAG: diguanylate cyclase [Gudongella sp.]|nr:diguanylate cyclase [Gudongella sp.]